VSFRRRITLAAAAAVAVAVMLASLLTYLLASHQLHKQVDEQLRSRSIGLRIIARTSPQALAKRNEGFLKTPLLSLESNPFGNLAPHPDQVRGYQQLVNAGGKILFRSTPSVTLPVETRTLKLAANGGAPFFRDARTANTHLRILTEAARRGYALQLAQPLTSVDRILHRLRIILVLLDIGGVALAALLGRLVAGAAVAPLKRLTEATEHVRRTQDLSERIEPAGEDEIGQLAEGFNAMLDALQESIGALDASVHAQRQLVADASHELRTPVTSLRTNIEVLRQQPGMALADRNRLLDDVVEQTEELTALMNDLIELSRDEQPAGESEDVRLDLVVQEAIERAHRHSQQTQFEVQLTPLLLSGAPQRLSRAINNLIDNAVAYSPAGTSVEVDLHGTELTVRDHGPGIAEQDLPHVFDRFYRGADARGRPGSGLGLAIVRQVAEQYGGSVRAERAAGGGTLMRLSLPGAEAVERPATAEPDLAARA